MALVSVSSVFRDVPVLGFSSTAGGLSDSSSTVSVIKIPFGLLAGGGLVLELVLLSCNAARAGSSEDLFPSDSSSNGSTIVSLFRPLEKGILGRIEGRLKPDAYLGTAEVTCCFSSGTVESSSCLYCRITFSFCFILTLSIVF